tara:strand:- start:2016 stop:2333 length:318 start_codon:yes stop_codon:yes gene_type:complete
MSDEQKELAPTSLEEAKEIAYFFQSFGYANALRAILDQVTSGELDLGPKASGFIAMQLSLAQKRTVDNSEIGTRFIDYWDSEGGEGPSSQTLHTLEDILGESGGE